MKKLIAIIAVALPLAFSARAQWIVYDPISNVQQILDEAENIAEYVDMVENQVQQIETLDNQLSEFKNYESLFGNPSQVLLSMVAPLDTDLKSLEPEVNLENLVASADGNLALTFNDSGIYATVGSSFQTPGGQTIQRPATQYEPFAAIINTASNFVAVAEWVTLALDNQGRCHNRSQMLDPKPLRLIDRMEGIAQAQKSRDTGLVSDKTRNSTAHRLTTNHQTFRTQLDDHL